MNPIVLEEDAELAGLGRSSRRVVIAWLLLSVVSVGAGFGMFHLYARQQSTADALHRAKASAEAARHEFYVSRNRVGTLERRARRAEDRLRIEGAALEADVERLRVALGPELTDSEALATRLRSVAGAAGSEVSVGPTKLSVSMSASVFFTPANAGISRDGQRALGRLIAAVRDAPVEVWVRTYPALAADGAALDARSLAESRAVAIAEHLRADGALGPARAVAVTHGAPASGAEDGRVDIILRAHDPEGAGAVSGGPP